MAGQAARIANLLDRLGRSVLEELGGLPDDALNRALPLPETNTLYALATHTAGAGEFWSLAMAGARPLDRDRAAEFRGKGTLADLVPRYERWLADAHATLDTLPDEALAQPVTPPPEFRPWGDEPMTLGDCLLHAVDHTALHLGHIQLTRQLLAGKEG
jgi:uncharacterized damage-inducible protein DinB